MRRTLLRAAIAALICGATLTTSANADPALPLPVADEFLSAPAALDTTTPGDVIRTRHRDAPLFVVAEVTQLVFHTTDSHGAAIPGIATVLTPPMRRPDNPVFVYDHAVNALGLRCAPSNAMWDNDPSVAMREAPILNAVLALGWTVVLPDHLGPKSAYGAAVLGGHITLDAARAAQRHTPLGLTNSPITLAGYSGGAMAVGWAASQASSYAPDLRISAAVIGGLPANIEVMAEALGHTRHPAFGIAAAVAFGLEREYGPELPISDYYNDEGRHYRASLNDACVNTILATGIGRSANDLGTSFELFYEPKTREVLRANSVEFAPAPRGIPIYEFHSRTDALIPLPNLDAMTARWRAEGAMVETVALDVPDHLSAAALGMPVAVAWLSTHLTLAAN